MYWGSDIHNIFQVKLYQLISIILYHKDKIRTIDNPWVKSFKICIEIHNMQYNHLFPELSKRSPYIWLFSYLYKVNLLLQLTKQEEKL